MPAKGVAISGTPHPAAPNPSGKEVIFMSSKIGLALVSALALGLSACSSAEQPESLVVLSHDSFDFPETLIKQFAEETGIDVSIQQIGDGGELANQLVLTKDAPLGDVVYGLDNTVSYRISGQDVIAETSVASPDKALDYAGEPGLIPIDQGDVCVNYDKAWFQGKQPPQTFEDLAKPEYKGLLVAMNPASSTPGMAFMLATIEHFGTDGWLDYWKQLRDNGVKITNGWSDAFSVDYSAGEGAGPFPMMVSYGSSPAYSVNEAKTESTTAALPQTCYRQVEYAGVLQGSKNPEAAAKFVEFMLTPAVQEAISEVTYMHPANPEANAPEDLVNFGPLATEMTALPADEVAANAEAWLRAWQAEVIG
ncbi:thiamine transport system substrate-binding protein [Bowdeniella nasicola]|uniref:Thiamine transport system substrate-binding protein n=1 Tax=Bowdeniella nasicola TaxID=208480 RepID=A0A1H3XS49_9ACTO|nr:thiamine ABC transporter substrate-binding protein [Bowdeniella nasicola]SEA02163.1 thiamine transport system substrate-binding protein [Bowdeniella nasicola]